MSANGALRQGPMVGTNGIGARWGRRVRGILPALLVFVAGIVGWQVLDVALHVQRFLLPPPTDIVAAFLADFGQLEAATQETVMEALGGLAVGVLLGTLMAIITARFTIGRRALLPFAIIANSIPTIAVAPVSNNWFGSSNPVSKIAIVALLVFFPTVIYVVRGLTNVDPAALDLMRSLGASQMQVFRKLRAPNALPYLFTALRIGTALSLIGAIVAEYFGGPDLVLGVWILRQAALFRFADAWAAILVACAAGIVLYLIVVAVEALTVPWAPNRRKA